MKPVVKIAEWRGGLMIWDLREHTTEYEKIHSDEQINYIGLKLVEMKKVTEVRRCI